MSVESDDPSRGRSLSQSVQKVSMRAFQEPDKAGAEWPRHLSPRFAAY
jgi:hypothetical protein